MCWYVDSVVREGFWFDTQIFVRTYMNAIGRCSIIPPPVKKAKTAVSSTSLASTLQIVVRYLKGNVDYYSVSQDATFGGLKDIMQDRTGTPAMIQRLTYGGKHMTGDKTLAQAWCLESFLCTYFISRQSLTFPTVWLEQNSIFHLVLAVRGS